MSPLRVLVARLRLLFRRAALEGEVEEEFRFHLEMETERLTRAGVPPDEARRRAVLAFGGVEGHREAMRDGWRIPVVEDAVREARHAFRSLRRSPAFAGAIVVTLGVSLGAVAAVFAVVDALLLRPLPYPQPERIHTLWAGVADGRTFGVTEPEALELPGRIAGVEHVGVWAEAPFNLAGEGSPEQVRGTRVSAPFFDVLGSAPALGRPFAAEEDTPGRDDVVILSAGFWSRRFGADSAAVGRTIRVDGRTRTIVGVMGPEFSFPRVGVDLWVPLAIDPAQPNVFDRYLRAAVRLAEGADPLAVAADARRVGAELALEVPARYGMRNVAGSFNLVPLKEVVVGDVRRMLLLVLAAASLVMLIASSNVGNLTLARREARMPELGLRAALGGSRARLLGVAVAESLVLSVPAGLLAAGLAWLGVRSFVLLAPPEFPRLSEIGVGAAAPAAAVGGAMGLSLLAALLAWAGPTRRECRRPLPGRERAGTASTGARRARDALVVSQLALALALLAGSGLLLRSLGTLLSEDPGFTAQRVLTARVYLPSAEYPGSEEIPDLHQRLVDGIAGMPGVVAAASTTSLPLSGGFSSLSYRLDGEPEDPEAQPPAADHQVVTSGYFEAMDIPLRAGRAFTEQDRRGIHTVVVSEALAREAWPGEDPIGKRVHLGATNARGEPEPHTVVGVAGDVRHHGPGVRPRPAVYFPNRPLPWGSVLRGVHLVVRTGGDPHAVLPEVRDAVAEVDSRLPLARIQALEEVTSAAVVRPRLVTFLLTAFAGVGLVIAIAGVYGLLAYTVSRRSREFGIRIALGESPREVRYRVVREAGTLVILGLAAGAVLFLTSSGFVAGLLHGVGARDPLTLAAAAAVLAGAALVASYRPALLASRMDPGQCLRTE